MKFRGILWTVGVVAALMLLNTPEVSAQCAMCRASVESNVSDGGMGLGSGLNKGILYLMLAPYVLLVIIAYAWYKSSKKYTEERRKIAQVLKRAV